MDVEGGVVELQRGSQTVVWEPRRTARVEVYREEPRTLMAGDRLRWTRNDRDSGRRNGDMAVVVAVDAGRGVAIVDGSGKNVTISLDRDRHWEHAYASTVHAAQGQTVDRVLVHLDTKYEKTMGSESFYVAISRARQEAKLYVNDKSGVAVALGRSLQRPYALEALTLARSYSQSDHLRENEAARGYERRPIAARELP